MVVADTLAVCTVEFKVMVVADTLVACTVEFKVMVVAGTYRESVRESDGLGLVHTWRV